jgi:hypothetical protein
MGWYGLDWSMKSTIFWDIMPCSPLSVNGRFGGTYSLRLQGRRNKLSHAGFLLRLFFRPWRWRRYVPPKRRLTPNGLHGVISQKMVLFITTAERTSNLTQFNNILRYRVSKSFKWRDISVIPLWESAYHFLIRPILTEFGCFLSYVKTLFNWTGYLASNRK